MKMARFIFLVIFVGVLCSGSVFAISVREIDPTSVVTDLAKVLRLDQKQQLEEIIKNIEKDTTAEIAVVLVDKMDGGGTLENFVNVLFNKFQVGKKNKNNGILFFVAVNNRMMRIEIGYGLEPVISTAAVEGILSEDLVPLFQKSEYYEGLKAGLESVRKYLYQNDVKEFFTMNWELKNFEEFIKRYPSSVLRCDALMNLGRSYREKANDSFFKKKPREQAINYYDRYLLECPDGTRKATVERELAELKK